MPEVSKPVAASATAATLSEDRLNSYGPVRVVPQPDPQDYTLDAEGYVGLKAPSGLPANSSFNITLWASDGTTTQTETVPVVIQAPCKRHY